MNVEKYPAKWNLYGKGAGHIRNKEMIDKGKPDKVVAFHSDISKSKGTRNMINQAKKLGIPTEIKCGDTYEIKEGRQGRVYKRLWRY